MFIYCWLEDKKGKTGPSVPLPICSPVIIIIISNMFHVYGPMCVSICIPKGAEIELCT